MARHALVVDGGDLAPGARTSSTPCRHRPPHAARAGEVLARAGVVDAAVGRRREQHSIAPDRLGDVEVACRAARVDGRGRRAPASSRGTPPCRAIRRAGSASSAATASSTAPPGTILSATGAHLVLEPVRAPRSPTRRSRRGRPWRRGSSGRRAGTARGRRPPCAGRSGASSSRRKRPNSAVAVAGRGGGPLAGRPAAARLDARADPAARPG